MGVFLETIFGGLMSGMLYALVALGFVLIFKASGVFNFAQGAMVLVAALAMARFSEWIPQWLGLESKLLANALAFIVCAVFMWLIALLIERFVLRYLVNQEGTTLLMATIGISYFLDGMRSEEHTSELQSRENLSSFPTRRSSDLWRDFRNGFPNGWDWKASCSPMRWPSLCAPSSCG